MFLKSISLHIQQHILHILHINESLTFEKCNTLIACLQLLDTWIISRFYFFTFPS